MNRPLFCASNAIHPVAIMPPWLQVLAYLNPLTCEVDALRALMLGQETTSYGLAVDFAVLARQLQARLTLLHVMAPLPTLTADRTLRLLSQATTRRLCGATRSAGRSWRSDNLSATGASRTRHSVVPRLDEAPLWHGNGPRVSGKPFA